MQFDLDWTIHSGWIYGINIVKKLQN